LSREIAELPLKGSLAFSFARRRGDMKKIAFISLLIIIPAIIGSMQLKVDPIPEPAIMFLLGVGFVVLSRLMKKDERK
jgi:hypothetical protein